MLATLNWMRSYRYRKEMNRHWSVSTSRHRSEDDKTICEERILIDDLFFWISIDHFYSWWNQRSSFEIFLIFDSDFYLYQSTLAASQFESEFDQQTIYSFESRSINFVSLRSQSNLSTLASHQTLTNFRKSSNSCNLAFYFVYQVVKFLQWRQIHNHKIDQKNDESWSQTERTKIWRKDIWCEE
jgi:hypothetical protein